MPYQMIDHPSVEGPPRRKIPRDRWTEIEARHANGESLVSIARDYRCTAPAVAYVIRQERRSDRLKNADDRPSGRVWDKPPAGLAESGLPPSAETPADLADVVVRSPALAQRSRPSFVSWKAGGLDPGLRAAVTMEISGFLVALDDVTLHNSAETVDRLREATDRLLRAAARVRVAIERHHG